VGTALALLKPELQKVEQLFNFRRSLQLIKEPDLETDPYEYSAQPTKNPFRYALAVWRVAWGDPTESTPEAAIVEIGFARSKFGRRFARWEEMVASLNRDPRTAEALRERKAFGPIDVVGLAGLPDGSLGRVFADHCKARQIDPNLIYVPPTDEVGWLLNHLYQTHDIWHVITGWGNDLTGEVGLGGFYCAQFGSPPFFGYMMALINLNVILRRSNLDEVFAAFSSGYRAGKRTEPMFGVDWDELWDVPIDDVRSRFAVDRSEIVGDGILAAA
jgi:ubiquinone biosynthesis protein COQ4